MGRVDYIRAVMVWNSGRVSYRSFLFWEACWQETAKWQNLALQEVAFEEGAIYIVLFPSLNIFLEGHSLLITVFNYYCVDLQWFCCLHFLKTESIHSFNYLVSFCRLAKSLDSNWCGTLHVSVNASNLSYSSRSLLYRVRSLASPTSSHMTRDLTCFALL